MSLPITKGLRDAVTLHAVKYLKKLPNNNNIRLIESSQNARQHRLGIHLPRRTANSA